MPDSLASPEPEMTNTQELSSSGGFLINKEIAVSCSKYGTEYYLNQPAGWYGTTNSLKCTTSGTENPWYIENDGLNELTCTGECELQTLYG